MKPLKNAIVVWICSIVVFTGSILIVEPSLPDHVATHFDTSGRPDGWMSQAEDAASWLMTGIGSSIFVIILNYSVRFFPPSTLNVPHSKFWREPENYSKACAFLFTNSFWFATLLVLFLSGLRYSVIQANRATPIVLNVTGTWLLLGLFLLGTVVWLVLLFRFFMVNENKPQ